MKLCKKYNHLAGLLIFKTIINIRFWLTENYRAGKLAQRFEGGKEIFGLLKQLW